MKIAVVGPLPPLRGGIAHYNASLVDILNKQDHNVLAISYLKLYPGFLFPGTSEIDSTSRPTEDSNPLLVAWQPWTWKKAMKLCRDNGVERLVVHHWHPFFAPCLRYLTKMKSSKGFVIIAHNVIPHEQKKAGRILNRWLFKKADKVIVGGKGEQDNLQQLVSGVPSTVIPHPVYDRFSNADPVLTKETAKQKLGYPIDQPLIMHIGLIRKYKGVDILLEAVPLIKNSDVSVEIAGEFYDDIEPYREQIKNLGIGNKVKLHNKYLVSEEMTLRLIAADVIVLPFRHATQSGVAMAALACGTPVIASKVGGLPDVILPGENGDLVPPENSGALAASIDKFFNIDKKIRVEMREKIKDHAHAHFSWERLADEITGEIN